MTEQNGVGRSSATEILRRLLDKRGVEWAVPDESWNQDSITYWKVGSIKWVAFESENGTLWLNCNSVTDLTPEQAIAATLGQEDTYTREDVEGAFVSGYSLGSLPVGSDPRWDENRQTVDEHMAELGWVRISDAEDSSTDTNGHDSGHVRNVSATLGRGECHDIAETPRYTDKTRFECSECGYEYSAVGGFGCDYGDSPDFDYCPNCGRKVVEK